MKQKCTQKNILIRIEEVTKQSLEDTLLHYIFFFFANLFYSSSSFLSSSLCNQQQSTPGFTEFWNLADLSLQICYLSGHVFLFSLYFIFCWEILTYSEHVCFVPSLRSFSAWPSCALERRQRKREQWREECVTLQFTPKIAIPCRQRLKAKKWAQEEAKSRLLLFVLCFTKLSLTPLRHSTVVSISNCVGI